LKLQELIDLSTDVIRLGPFTLLTVDEGYAAITQDNGKQRVLPGGSTHMLTHRNWKFEKLISLKIHTDDLGPFRATSADNVVLETIATVNWRVQDAPLAARMAADTMNSYQEGQGQSARKAPVVGVGADSSLKKDVLKQAIASLAAAIGSIRYADDVHISANEKVNIETSDIYPQEQRQQPKTTFAGAENDDGHGVSQIFSVQQMSAAAQHANEIVTQYGVSIVSINVISAVPMDKKLEETLSAGAVAAAGAVQAEIAARGNAKARLINAQSEANANRIHAQARADAEVTQAKGKKEAAALLEASDVAVDLAKLEKTGQILGEKTSFFFGTGPSMLPALMSNPKCLPDCGV
jgi:regulator of protease activity HflC (stomatin/prohibitin superfamily)